MEPLKFSLIFAIVLVLVLVLVYVMKNREGFSDVFYLDQMAMKNSDPMYFKYSSWERDVDGMSPRDYYLENQTNYLNGIAPGYFVRNGLYVDHTGYLNMPPQYRPSPALDTMPISAGAPTLQSGTGDDAEEDALNVAATEGTY